ncbi:MAG: PAS domain S-box protein [Syntrophales bacterium]
MTDQNKTTLDFTEEIAALKQRIRTLEKVEEALRESEGKFRDLAEKSIVGIYLIQDSLFKYVNGEFAAIFGYAVDEIIDRLGPKEVIYPEDLPLVEESIRRRLAGELKSLRYEFRIWTKSREIRHAAVYSSRTLCQGKPAVIGTVLDITEHKRAEAALMERTEELDRFFMLSLDMLCVADTDGYFRRLNPEWEATLGYKLEELEGRRFLDFVHPDDLERTLSAVSDLSGGKQVLNFTNRYLAKDGTYRWIEWRSVPYQGKLIYAAARDITERIRTEQALRDREFNLRSIFRVAPIGIGLVSNRIIRRVNDRLCAMIGYSREELLGKSARILYRTDEEFDWVGKEKYRQIAEQGTGSVETRWIRKDGAVIDVFLSSTPLDTANLEAGVTFTALDITDRNRAESALRESKRRYDTLAANIPVGVYLLRTKPAGGFSFEYASPQMAKMLGLSVKGILADPQIVFQPIHPEEREAFVRYNFETIAARQPFLFEGRVVVNGEVKWMRIESQPEPLDNGDVLWHGILDDITARKEAEKSLRESEERFRALSENAPDIIYTMNLEGAITYANPAWERILGHGEEELRGRYFTDFAKEEDRRIYRKLFKGIRDEGKSVNNHIGIMLTKDGAERVFNMNSAFNRDMEGRVVGIVGTMKDITELRDLEKKLSHAQKMEAIGTLAGGIAHDFNNLLMGIQGYASLTLLNLDFSHPSYERIKQIEGLVQSGADLTRQLLGFARGGRYEVKTADMNTILEKSSSIFERTKKEITIHRKYGKDLWNVEADQGQMEQVFMNLFVNAWQAMPGGGEIYLETEKMVLDGEQALAYAVKAGPYIKISMTDTGTGMDEKTRERIFDPFFTTKEMGRGTGLGLATVYGIIIGHGGAINVYSEPGHGTTFTIYLPASEKKVTQGKTTPKTITARGTETILLVDDEKMILEVNKELLEAMGYTVYAAGSGQEAIAVYLEKGTEIDLTILDMVMPGISGGETFDRLRQINPELRVLLSSGYSISGQAQEILDRGCNGFIQKPFHPEKLSLKVRELLT